MAADGGDGDARRDEIYTWEAPHPVFALAWSNRPDTPFRLAVGSFIEDYGNRIDIVSLGDGAGDLTSTPSAGVPHPYPPTRLAFTPDRGAGTAADVLASAGDVLRLWKVAAEGGGSGDGDGDAAAATATPTTTLAAALSCGGGPGGGGSDYCAPLTSLDWNDADPRRVGTASIDTTCTIWDVEKGVVDTQLIAHDREVYDIAWGGVAVFASASADGSVRVFDLRDRDHSTIVYEHAAPSTPLLRLAWNKQDPRYMATTAADSPAVAVLDIRFPAAPVAELARHAGAANALAWAPHSSCHMCTAGDDAQALIWDLSALGGRGGGAGGAGAAAGAAAGLDPILAYSAGAPVVGLEWSAAAPDWVAVAFASRCQILRV